jgi:Serine/threonine protein kinase
MEETVISERYEVLGTLGKGGMGIVLKCQDTILQRVVAIKVLGTTTSGNAIKRFQREARAAAKLKQANILQVHDFGETSDGKLYLVMDFVEGVTLEQLLKERRFLPIEQAIPLFQQICKGVAHAHGQGVLHRDIKPSNIMLDEVDDAWVKIVDFGIAKLNSEDQRLTSTGAIIGSPPYMAPEATINEKVDARTDIYSIGCLMFETLAGSPPFDGETAMAIVMMHTTEPVPSLSQRSEQSLPADIEHIVKTCMAKEPGDRYQSVDELLKDLERLEEALLAEGDNEKEVEEVGEHGATQTFVNAQSPTPKSFPVAPLIAISLVIIAVGIAAILNLTKFGTTSDSQPLTSKVSDDNPFKDVIKEKSLPAKYERDLQGGLFRILMDNGEVRASGDTDDAQVEKQFEQIKNGQIWHFSMSSIGLPSIELIAKSNVRYLELKHTQIDDKCMEVIGGIQNLEGLELTYCENITPAGFKFLKNSKHLRTLQFSLPKNPKKAMELIETVTTIKPIKNLFIKGTMNGAMIEKLDSIKGLRYLQMDIPTEDGWNQLKRLQRGLVRDLRMETDPDDLVPRNRLAQLKMPNWSAIDSKDSPASVRKYLGADVAKDAAKVLDKEILREVPIQ